MADRASLISLDRVELTTPSRLLVADLTLEVRSGERWAILGPNGAGKSTLLAAMSGARRVDGGVVACDGRPIRALAEHELASRRALVTDRWSDPFSSSVLDTVLTARYVFDDESIQLGHARDLLAMLDASHLASNDVRRLSRGERQRVAIATALAQDTPLVLLDEPTAHQDPRHQALVIERLMMLTDRGFVASLHDLNAAARFATHALLLNGEGTFSVGPAPEVLTPAALSTLFRTPIRRVEVEGEAFFHVHRPT